MKKVKHVTDDIPGWIDFLLLPLLNIFTALFFTGLFILLIGENPFTSIALLFKEAIFAGEGINYTIFYATTFIFTGLSVAVASHVRLFNIGSEGQMLIGGLGITLMALAFDSLLPPFILVPLLIVSSIVFGALWALIPGYLQAYRNCHIVITTIMFNFIASALMLYLLNGPIMFKEAYSPSPESRRLADSAIVPKLTSVFDNFGYGPANFSIFLALIVAFLVWWYVFKTRSGYNLRAVGKSATSSHYAGIAHKKVMIYAMIISGALAGMGAVNIVLGEAHLLRADFSAGAGFIGIAVALMGRNHPIGVILSAFLFAALTQGSSMLSFEVPRIDKEIVSVIQAFVIYFSGALAFMYRPIFVKYYQNKVAKINLANEGAK